MQTLIPMAPVADITEYLDPNFTYQPRTTIDGNLIYINNTPVSSFYHVAEGNNYTLNTPPYFVLSGSGGYRNEIWQAYYQRGTLYYIYQYSGGRLYGQARFDGNGTILWNSGLTSINNAVYNTQLIQVIFPTGIAGYIGGYILDGAGGRNALVWFDTDGITSELQYSIYSKVPGGGSASSAGVVFGNPNGGYPYAVMPQGSGTTSTLMELSSFELQTAGGEYVTPFITDLVDSYYQTNLSYFHDEPFTLGSTLTNAGYQLYGNSIVVTNWGAAINPTTGKTNTPQSGRPFDINIGGQYMTPVFLASFELNGTKYIFNGESLIQCMTTVGNNIYAVAKMITSPGGTYKSVLFTAGLIWQGIYLRGTYNWKRSLTHGYGTYSMRGNQIVFASANGIGL